MRFATTGSTPNPCVPSSASPLSFNIIRWKMGPFGFLLLDFGSSIFFFKDDPSGSFGVRNVAESNFTKPGNRWLRPAPSGAGHAKGSQGHGLRCPSPPTATADYAVVTAASPAGLPTPSPTLKREKRRTPIFSPNLAILAVINSATV